MDDQQREQKRIDDIRLEVERRRWLISIPEGVADKLSIADQYDRIRFLREKLGEDHVRSEQMKPAGDRKRFWHEK